jgi:aspartate oxidase
VLVVSKAPLGAEASSLWAQGGLAAAMGGDDNPVLHLADTIAAGAGLSEEAIARRIVEAAPAAVEHLARLGVAFDRRTDGSWRLGLEAAHSRNRIVHATGDGTGREIMRALIAAARKCPSVTLLEGVEARSLIVEGNAIKGVLAQLVNLRCTSRSEKERALEAMPGREASFDCADGARGVTWVLCDAQPAKNRLLGYQLVAVYRPGMWQAEPVASFFSSFRPRG